MSDGHIGFDEMIKYPLFEALFKRRSRRMMTWRDVHWKASRIASLVGEAQYSGEGVDSRRGPCTQQE